MSDPARVRRTAERIRELVAANLKTQVKDPRLGMITVTDARITGDLRDATVYYTVLGDAAERSATAAALDSAKGMLRSQVGRRLGLRHSPSLTFVADHVEENAHHIDELLARARTADESVQRLAQSASYAGDAQPYRLDESDVDEDLESADESAVRGQQG